MHFKLNKSLLAVAVSSMLVAPLAEATNGYFAHGYSTKEKGLAGAGTAYSQDSLAAATNPAGMAFVGERMDIGLALFSPSDRGYTASGLPPAPAGTPISAFCTGGIFPPAPGGSCNPPLTLDAGSATSENDIFLIPQFGYNWPIDNKSTMGISIYGNGGMDTEYSNNAGSVTTLDPGTLQIVSGIPGTFGAGAAGVQLAQLFFNLSYSYKLNNDSAVGASVILAYQQFSAFGLAGFGNFSNDPSNLTTNTNSYSHGFGFKLGYQGKVMDNLTVGVSYQTEMSMTEFDEYKGLFAEDGDFDIPSNYNVGLMYDMGDSGKVVVDVQRINYSDVAAIANPIDNFFPDSAGNPRCIDPLNASLFGVSPGGPGCLGGANGAGFGWEDMTIVKLGYEMMSGSNTYRFGISHGDQPIPEDQTLFNILAPAVIETHITFGMTMPMAKNQELNMTFMIAPNNSVKGANPFDGGATDIEIEMEQKELQVGYAWKY